MSLTSDPNDLPDAPTRRRVRLGRHRPGGRVMMLTDAERDSLNECPDCGHYLNEHDDLSCSHSTAGCDCGCICFLSKASARLAAVEALVAARDQAWRDRILAVVAPLVREWRYCIESDCRLQSRAEADA